MSRFHSYLSTACRLIDLYHAGKPFAHHLKGFFSAEKKYGSRDRKIISSICYQYLRTSHLFDVELPAEEKIIFGVYLCENEYNDFLQSVRPELNEKIKLPIEEKFNLLNVSAEKIFPFYSELSDEIQRKSYAASFLKQPKFFIRLRPTKKSAVLKKLNDAGISYEVIGDNSLSLPQNTALENVVKLNKDVVVQDLSSQRIFDWIDSQISLSNNQSLDVWDCCAASGGKSILLFDRLEGKIKLTVSDIRKNIIQNLKERLAQSGIPVYKTFVQDLALSSGLSLAEKFGIVVCDVPCSGSGTWSRNPEQLHSFKRNSLSEFSSLQMAIVSNVIPHVSENGYFIYITCSVFKKENEEVVSFINEKTNLQLLHMSYLKGYEDQADTMFVAAFKR